MNNNPPQFQCACPNLRCEFHGNCHQCRVRHGRDATYCRLRGFRKQFHDLLSRFFKR